ncbi:hypothetical protein PENTCL1PPCAC_25924, partial [Pristionchus entomophagus]
VTNIIKLMSELEDLRTKACGLSSSDRIGHVIARTFDVFGAVSRDGVGSESVSEMVELLAQDRAFAMKKDNNDSTPLRELVYGMIGSFGSMIEDIAKKRVEEILKMGETPSNVLALSENNTGLNGDSLPLFPDDVKEEIDQLNAAVKVEDEEAFDQSIDQSMDTMNREPAVLYGLPGTSQQPTQRSIRLSDQYHEEDVKIGNVLMVPTTQRKHINHLISSRKGLSTPPTVPLSYRCPTCGKVFSTRLGLCGHSAVHK